MRQAKIAGIEANFKAVEAQIAEVKAEEIELQTEREALLDRQAKLEADGALDGELDREAISKLIARRAQIEDRLQLIPRLLSEFQTRLVGFQEAASLREKKRVLLVQRKIRESLSGKSESMLKKLREVVDENREIIDGWAELVKWREFTGEETPFKSTIGFPILDIVLEICEKDLEGVVRQAFTLGQFPRTMKF